MGVPQSGAGVGRVAHKVAHWRRWRTGAPMESGAVEVAHPTKWRSGTLSKSGAVAHLPELAHSQKWHTCMEWHSGARWQSDDEVSQSAGTDRGHRRHCRHTRQG